MSKEKTVGLDTKSISKAKKVEKWSQSTKKGDWTEEIEVEKLSNKGYLVIVSKYGNDSKGNYKHNSKKLFSEINPLDDNEIDNPISKLGEFLIGENR